jgi:ABC-type amino acid transport system permease subunit
MPDAPAFDMLLPLPLQLPLPLIAAALAATAALLAVVAFATTAFGLRQRRYDGWHWWTTALWQGAAAVALAAAALHEQGALVPLAVAALLPAPLLALQGLRRFHPRHVVALHARADAGVALLAAALLGLAAALPEPLAHPLAAATVLGLHGYVAAVLLLGPGGPDFVPVQVLALAVNTCAYTTEIFAGAIRATSAGEVEAARSLGMGRLQLMRRIVLPSALRRSLPAYGNEVILMLHATSLASVVTLLDLTGAARELNSRHYLPFEAFLTAAAFYLVLSLALVALFQRAERRWLAHLQARC